MALSPLQIAIVLILALLLFGGGGRISSIMGDVAKGLKAFRSGLKDDDKDKSLEERADEAVDVTPPKEEQAKAQKTDSE